METKNYSVTIRHKGNNINVLCQEFQVGQVPQIWACIPAKNPIHSKCFTFYRIEPQIIKWYALSKAKQEIAEKINDALLRL